MLCTRPRPMRFLPHVGVQVDSSEPLKLEQSDKNALFWVTWLRKSTRMVWRRPLKNDSRSLYVAGQIREINVLAAVAASLQSLSGSCRLHVGRLKRYFIEVFWGGGVREGRVHFGDAFSVSLGSFQVGWPTSPTCDLTPSLCV